MLDAFAAEVSRRLTARRGDGDDGRREFNAQALSNTVRGHQDDVSFTL